MKVSEFMDQLSVVNSKAGCTLEEAANAFNLFNTYNFYGGRGNSGEVLRIVDGEWASVPMPSCCCDDKPARPRKKSYNCPNCGAPITGPRCEYCDTLLVEPTYYQFNIPYSGGSGGSYCNIRQQLEEAQARAAQNMQTNFILQSIHPYIPRPASLGTVKTR